MITSLDTCIRADMKTAAIAGHVNPDGDCVGSCLAVYNYLCTYYPEMETVLYLEAIPEKFLFLPRAAQIQGASSEERSRTFDLFIALDCADRGRMGAAAHFFKTAGRTLCVDHHLTNTGFADENYIFPSSSSASELVYELMDKERITEPIAECLYLGIVHDTGVFQYSSTSPKTMEVAGDLMGRGIPYSRIVDETFFQKTYVQRRISGYAAMKSRLCMNGKCIYCLLTREEMARFGATAVELEGVVSELRSTVGVEVSAFFYPTGTRSAQDYAKSASFKESYKISLRSASCVDVAKVAAKFGGGGHARAAGGSMAGQAGEVVRAVLTEVAAELSLELPEDLCITEF